MVENSAFQQPKWVSQVAPVGEVEEEVTEVKVKDGVEIGEGDGGVADSSSETMVKETLLYKLRDHNCLWTGNLGRVEEIVSNSCIFMNLKGYIVF